MRDSLHRVQRFRDGGPISACEQSPSPRLEIDRSESDPLEKRVGQSVVDIADTGIIIVNWNSWPETLEALEAVFRMKEYNGPVVVCDNASTDGSLEYIRQWAQGKLCALPESLDPEIRSLVVPPVSKDFKFAALSCREVDICALEPEVMASRLWLIDCAENRGFGAGSNVGIRLLQRMPRIQNFWLLNSDALPARQAYRELKNELLAQPHKQPIICGSVLMEYWAPASVQACGAKYNPLLCSVRDNFKGMSANALGDLGKVYQVDYPVGASLVVNREFLDKVGLMCEDYFLYFEELDWVRRLGWPSVAFIVTSSHIYHKGGSTTGAGSSYKTRSLKADYYFLRSRILFATKFGRLGVLIVAGASMYAIVKRSLLFDRRALANALKALADGFQLTANRH